VTPVDVRRGRYVAPTCPGAGTEMLDASITRYSVSQSSVSQSSVSQSSVSP